ncbi:MAG: hypothetical protein QM714_19455 [Nocardioides sp.]|uniref:hypothetical protein n=1 Tax=Nocardioides sp. TaxID=35761 RepID=UPI0039E6DC86
MSRARKPFIPDRQVALWIGYGGIIIGAVALWDAYEGRGRRRPFATKLLPGG